MIHTRDFCDLIDMIDQRLQGRVWNLVLLQPFQFKPVRIFRSDRLSSSFPPRTVVLSRC